MPSGLIAIAKPCRLLRAAICAGFWLLPVHATAQTDLRSLFPSQAPIYVTSDGLSKLDLPVEIVSALNADRSDLRILDAQGVETAFTVDAAMRSTPARQVAMRHPLEILEVDRGRSNPVAGPPIYRERYILATPPDLDAKLVWDLVFDTPQPEFVRRVRVTALMSGKETPLAEGVSLFRLTNPPRERVRIVLPRFLAPQLAVSIEGEDNDYIEPVFRLEHSYSVAPPEQDRLDLPMASRRDEETQTVIEVERPRGIRPSALLLETSAAAFSRTVEVWDEGQGASGKKIGFSEIYRVPGPLELEELSVPLNLASGTRLRLVIENGDSPPLPDFRVTAVSQRLTLLFILPSRGAEPAGALLFGGGRARAAQYDLARLRTSLTPPQHAGLATDLYDSAPARLGPIAPNAAFGASPALSFAMRPGGPVDQRLYTHRRTVRLEPSSDGLSLLPLAIEDLAEAQSDLRDVRIVDASSRQWAYVVEEGKVAANGQFTIAGPHTENGISRYTLTPPAAPATLFVLDLDIREEFFDRAFELYALSGDQESRLLHGRLQRRAGESPPTTIEVQAERIDALELVVSDGDDAPLDVLEAVGRFSVARMYVAAPAGDYTLLLGNTSDALPSYELAQVRSAVLSASAADAQLGVLEENPAYSARARIGAGDGPQHALLWGALILAVGGLSAVTLRMARRNPSGQPHASKDRNP